MAGTFAFTDAVVANTRRKDDYVNGASGACAAGFLAGLRGEYLEFNHPVRFVVYCRIARSLPMAVGSCAVLGAFIGTYDAAGQLTGGSAESKEERRKRFFKQTPADTTPQ